MRDALAQIVEIEHHDDDPELSHHWHEGMTDPHCPGCIAAEALAGPKNTGWKGDEAGYQAMHARIERLRGKPTRCEECGADDADLSYDWANLTGNYADPQDYKRMCRSCHRLYDNGRRRGVKQDA